MTRRIDEAGQPARPAAHLIANDVKDGAEGEEGVHEREEIVRFIVRILVYIHLWYQVTCASIRYMRFLP